MVGFQEMPATSDPLVVVLQIVIAGIGQMTNTTASKAQGTTVMLRGWDEGRVPAEGDRFQSVDGTLDGDNAQRDHDYGFQYFPSGRQETGTFRTGVPRYWIVDATVRPFEIHRFSRGAGTVPPVGWNFEQAWFAYECQ